MDGDGCFGVIALFVLLLLLLSFVYSCGAKSVHIEAVERKYGRWETNSYGHSKFKWQDETDSFRNPNFKPQIEPSGM